MTDWTPNWPALADHLVNKALRLRRGERVLFMADPEVYPDCLERLREAVQVAGGVELATILAWTQGLGHVRDARGHNPDPELDERERLAHLQLFHLADVFVWLPNNTQAGYPVKYRNTAVTAGESEWIVGRWRGRGVHFHWMPDAGSPPGAPIHDELGRIYERAILDLDYDALRARQRRLVETVRGRTVHITSPGGTDLRFDAGADAWYHFNDGDASPEKAERALCARDREEELPCGAVRTPPLPNSVNGVLALPETFNQFGVDLREPSPLEIVFKDGRISEFRSGGRRVTIESWERASGDKDRLGEVTFGTNPLLETPPGAHLPAYWGLGAGVFKFQLGDNRESGGVFGSSMKANVFVSDATITAGDTEIVSDGKLLID